MGGNWMKLNIYLWGAVMSLATDNIGNIYVGTGANDTNLLHFVTVLKWDGTTWSEPGFGNTIQATAQTMSFCFDSANNVYAAGSFFDINGYSCVAKWDGTTWNAMGPICLSSSLQTPTVGSSNLSSMAVHSDCMDRKGDLYAAGQFVDSNGTFFVAKYTGPGNITSSIPGIVSGNELNIRAYPNPANEILNIEMDGNSHGTAEIILYDLFGRIIKEQQISAGAHATSMISVSQLPPANYFLRIKGDNNNAVKTISIMH